MAGVDSSASFKEAEEWFVGGLRSSVPSLAEHVPENAASPALRALATLSFDEDLLELLPYMLELHGPGSRLSVMRNPSTRLARQAKRKNGVFYTPADVAEYMVREALDGHGEDLRCLDPSCGTGVYLVALLRTMAEWRSNGKPFDRLAFATRSLYGFDLSTIAVESCAFVLLHHCLKDVNTRKIAPWAAWHALRLNLVATDALRFQAVSGESTTYTEAKRTREWIRWQLVEGGYVAPVVEKLPTEQQRVRSLFVTDDGFPPLGAVIPEAEAGFEVLVGNPPYAILGRREDRVILEREYSSIRAGNGGTSLYPLFIEMMWRLTQPGRSTAALVVPLSIAYHQGAQFRACRQGMMSNGGQWRFAFFDREPHALFGEDVKTRNAIVFRSDLENDPKKGAAAHIETGPLRKWTSRTRDKLFTSVTFTPLGRVPILDGIPKLSGNDQALVFSMLSARVDHLRTFCECCRTCHPHEATLASDHPRVFVGSTAYNFLNVFHSITLESDLGYPLSENTVHCLEFAREDYAEMAFAILSSRLTYWLWHIDADGFHVGSWFIQNLPFGRASFNEDQARALQSSGRQMWEALQAHRIVSLNKGKQTVAYRPLACERERDIIDNVLIEAAKLPEVFKQTLKAFVKEAVVVDHTDSRRNHLKSLFDNPGEPVMTSAADIKEKSKLTKEEWREYTKNVWQIANTSHSEHPSVFPVEIPHRLIKLFTFQGDTVLDPFGGVGTTAKAALPIGRNVVCVDQSENYVNLMRAECKPANGKKESLLVVHGDSRRLDFLKDASVGLIVTSPPYWNKADYGKNVENIGNVGNYQAFFREIRPVFEECYRVLQPGRKLCIITAHVNQHTNHGLLTFPLATDFTVLLRDLGFVMVNEIIWNKDGTGGKWGSYGEQRPIFGSYPYPPNFHFKNVHEYILILAKPSEKIVRGPKVKNYEEVMGIAVRPQLTCTLNGSKSSKKRGRPRTSST